MKFIISFTTSPTRIYKIEKMMNAIINQTVKPDLIILNIPKIFHRTNETYQIPDYLNSIYDKFVINHIETDYGPATKIYPTIIFLLLLLLYNIHQSNDRNTMWFLDVI